MDRKKTFVGTSNNGSSSIKGLQLFIADLRSAPHLQDQERRIQSEITKIKQNFDTQHQKQSKGQDKQGGYQRKKYIAKLAYIYITSNTSKLNDIIFGLDQTMELIQSSVYSEKFIAYMTIELLYEHKTVMDKINDALQYQILLDLRSNDENFVSLALNCVGIVGSLSKTLSNDEDIVAEVFQILRSPTSSMNLKKKSSLAFLTLLKKNNAILTNEPQRKQIWIQRILSLLDNRDNYRLTLASLPLIEYIAVHVDPAACTRLVPQLTQTLYSCLMNESSSNIDNPQLDFRFANMPNPWIITKTVSLLNMLIISSNEKSSAQNDHLLHTSTMNKEILNTLRTCISQAIQLGERSFSDPMERIVQNTILFSLINFAPKLDPSDDAITDSVTALCKLLSSGQINIRYLALDSLIKLCSVLGTSAMNAVRLQNLDMISQLLYDERDASIIRKLADLLYIFTDSSNVKKTVDDLLQYITSSKQLADPNLKSDIAVKIAVLSEKYATDSNWFVTVSLKLLSFTSLTSINDDEIWQRLCQIVVNNPALQRTACEQLLYYFKNSQTSEPLIKTGAFLFGEFIDQITDLISVADLFNIFTTKYFTVTNFTKAMILTTVMKLYRCSDSIYTGAVKIYQMELSSLDIELQSRSYEYLNILRIARMENNPNLINILFHPIPPFNSSTNPLLKRLGLLQTSDNDLTIEALTSNPSSKDSSNPFTQPTSTDTSVTENGKNMVTQEELYNSQILAASWRDGFSRMLSFKRGILFSSSLLKILYRLDYPSPEEPYQQKISLTFINESEWDMTNFSTNIIPFRTDSNPEYVVQEISLLSALDIAPRRRTEQTFDIIIRRQFNAEYSPIISIFFKCGASTNTINLKLGVGLNSTLRTTEAPKQQLTLAQFFSRWKALGDALGTEGECIITKLRLKSIKNISHSQEESILQVSLILKRMGFDIVEQSNLPNSLFFAGIIHTKTDGNYGCLIRVSCEDEEYFTLTCRATIGSGLATNIASCIKLAAFA